LVFLDVEWFEGLHILPGSKHYNEPHGNFFRAALTCSESTSQLIQGFLSSYKTKVISVLVWIYPTCFAMGDVPSPLLPEIAIKGCPPTEFDVGTVDGHSEIASFEHRTMYVF
jgi:hypothetical protein